LIGKISNDDIKKQYLSKLKDLILKEEKKAIKFDIETPSLTKLFQKYQITNPFQQLTTKDIQVEVSKMEAQVRDLRQEIINPKATYLELQTKLSILETRIPSYSKVSYSLENIGNTPENEVSEEQFLHIISQVTFQKCYSVVKIVLHNFSINAIAAIDSGADQNCIREGIIPTKCCERMKEQLCSANEEPLNIKCKLNKGHIQNNDYCFENIFLIVENITHDLIFGTPFLMQVY